MKNLSDITNITPEQIELLEAAGFLEPNSLRATTIEELHEEIVKANSMLGIMPEAPSKHLVAKWFEQVEADVDIFSPLDTQSQKEAPQSTEPSRAEKAPQKVPVAIPITPDFIKQKGINLGVLPRAGEVIELGGKSSPQSSHQSAAPASSLAKGPRFSQIPDRKIQPRISLDSLPAAQNAKAKGSSEIQKDKVLSMDEFRERGGKVAPLQRSMEKDITKTTLEETNRGIDPKSRRYIRGVLHKEPNSVLFASFSILLAQVLVVLSVLPLPLVLLDRDKYLWAAFCPLLTIVALFIWFFSARRAMCPVCRQRQFVPKSCLKHNKAHRLPLIGHMASTAIHIIGFKWFRCIFCGTSIRLKE